MPNLLSEGVRKQLKEMYKDLKNPVALLFFGSKGAACEYCDQTLQLLEELSGISSQISLQLFDLDQDAEMAARFGVDKAPGIVIAGKDGEQIIDYRIRFYGIPAGSEFTSLVNDIVLVSRRDSGLAAETRQFLRSLKEPVNLQVFVTPT